MDYPDDLEADFQETYGVSIYGLPERKLAALAYRLPATARAYTRIDAANQNSVSDVLLANIIDKLNIIDYHYVASHQKKNAKRVPKPKPVQLPGMKREHKESEVAAMDIDEFNRIREGRQHNGN